MHLQPGGMRRFCDHCRTQVHDLSAMDEASARTFLRATEGAEVCISYVEDASGAIVFHSRAPARSSADASVVPLSRVRASARRWQTIGAASLPSFARAAGAALSAGVVGALTGCTPHGPPAAASVELVEDAAPSVAPTVVIPAEAPPKAGGGQRLEMEEPCEPEREPKVRRRGARRKKGGLMRSGPGPLDSL
ncbi:hypothetical protein [Plesiocystis pacifica]|nr:hypothetical protein [Plesiocystis pacifica]